MRLSSWKWSTKEFLRKYIVAPALWQLSAKIIGKVAKNPSYLNKQKRQYPYCWIGQDFPNAFGGKYLVPEMRTKLSLITRNLESKAAIVLPRAKAVSIQGLPLKTSHMILAVSTIKPHIFARDLSVCVEGKQVVRIRGELMREAWQHFRVPVPSGGQSFDIEFSWFGGDLYLADPVAEFPARPNVVDNPDKMDLSQNKGYGHRRPNVIVLVLDSLMAPAVGCLNGVQSEHSMTPNIDRYFKNGRLFRNAYSVSEYTMPSLATMATGLYPIEHGVFTHDKSQRELPRSIPTLAETMRDNGYRTLGYSTGARFSPLYAHYRGYDRFFQHHMSHRNTADVQVDRAIEFMEAHPEHPTFCFLHMIDPHPPFPLPTYYSDICADGDLRWGDSRSLYSAFKLHRDSSRLVDDLRTVEKRMIRNLDMILARLFAWLQYSGRGDNTNVLLLSDHGREYRKGDPLFTKSLTHVPFLIGGVGVSPDVCEEFSEAPLDLFPTVAGLAGILAPSHLSGLDMSSAKIHDRETCISESLFRRTGEIVLRRKDWLYGLRCEFDYMKGQFKHDKVLGEWLYPRNSYTAEEDLSVNHIETETSLVGEFRSLVYQHYKKRKRRFDDSHVLDFSKEYPE